MSSGLRPVLGGAAIGTILASQASPFLESLLFEIRPGDPLSTVGAVLILATTAVAACAFPALRAARTDPNRALRTE